MSRNGQITQYPLAELIRAAAIEQLSGVFRLGREQAKAAIYFESGNVVFATSNLRAHRLREVLGREDFKLELEGYPPGASDGALAEALLKDGRITMATMAHARTSQVSDVLRVALLWTDGDWEFDPRVRLADDVRVLVDVNRLLLECARHLPPDFIGTRLMECNGAKLTAPADSAVTNLLPTEAFVLSRVSAPLTLGELNSIAGVGEAESLRAIYALVLAGYLQLTGWPSSLPSATPRAVKKPSAPTPARKEPVAAKDELADIEELFKRLAAAKDHYDVLGIGRLAESTEIKTAYHALALRFHPDRFHQSDPTLRARIDSAFARIAQAYEILGDSSTRASYDAKVRSQPVQALDRKPATAITSESEQAASLADQQRAEGVYQRGTKALQSNRRDEAIRLLSEAAMLRPREARYRANYGYALITQSGTQRIAETELKAAIALEPENISYRVMLAELYKEMGLLRRAEGELERILKTSPRHEAAQALLQKLRKK